tara:strand:- start:1036 stop:1506 length:471 start_codon:yes stop_codon:yes gene_type:complete
LIIFKIINIFKYMVEFTNSNDFDRFINLTIYIYGINLLNDNDNNVMDMKISIQEIKKNKNNTFEIFRKKIEDEVKKFIVTKIKENCTNIVEISKNNSITLHNIVQCLFINNKIDNIFIEWSSSSLKEFLYVPNNHYLIYFEDNILLRTKKVNFQYS